MNIYLNGADAVSDLHKNGFTNDFHLIGDDLWWVEENIIIKAAEFVVLEYHKIKEIRKNMDVLAVFGIAIPHHNVKGILVNHCKRYTGTTPPVLARKLEELEKNAGNSYCTSARRY